MIKMAQDQLNGLRQIMDQIDFKIFQVEIPSRRKGSEKGKGKGKKGKGKGSGARRSAEPYTPPPPPPQPRVTSDDLEYSPFDEDDAMFPDD